MNGRESKAETFIEIPQEDVFLIEIPTKYKWILISMTVICIILIIALIYIIATSDQVRKLFT